MNPNNAEPLPTREIVIPAALLIEDVGYWDSGQEAPGAAMFVGGDHPALRAMRRRDDAIRQWAASIGISGYQGRELIRIAQQAQRDHRASLANPASAGLAR